DSARVEALDQALGLPEGWDEQQVASSLKKHYAETELGDAERRLALMDADPEAFENSDDPFIKLAVALYDHEMQLEHQSDDRSGRMQILRPDYMEAIIAWQESQGYAAYPDANSTLRITYGTVMGGEVKDGMIYKPFTTLEGIVQKDTGKEPFNAPERQLELIRAGKYGGYELESIDSVPVNFLTDLDVTGGNSGSATLNARGELVGL